MTAWRALLARVIQPSIDVAYRRGYDDGRRSAPWSMDGYLAARDAEQRHRTAGTIEFSVNGHTRTVAADATAEEVLNALSELSTVESHPTRTEGPQS